MKTTYLGIGVLALLALGAFALFGRGGGGDSAAAPATALPAQAAVTPAPAFTLNTLSGAPLSLADYKGKKAVVLDFWATWCPNCQRDIPHLESFYEKYQDQVEVVGVDLQEDPAIVKAFVAKYGMTYPVVLDPQGVATQAYAARYTNYHILINKDGNIVGTVPGDVSEADFEKLIAS